MSEEKTEVSFDKMIQRRLIKYRRLFPESPIFYKGLEAVNTKTHERGIVDSLTLNDVSLKHKDKSISSVRFNNIMLASTYDKIISALVLCSIFYKGKETPAALISEATYLLPCSKIFEEFSNILEIPNRENLKGIEKDRYFTHLRKFLKRISWEDKTPDEIDSMSELDLNKLVSPYYYDEDGNEMENIPVLTLSVAQDRILEVYKITPCESCTMPLTCDCSMRIVQQVRGEKAASYKIAQHTIRENSELMSFLLKGVFRGKPRVRWEDYDKFLQDRINQDYDPKWVKVVLTAVRTYEAWSGRKVSSEVTTTIYNALKQLGYSSVDELEAA
jgi:hypothetical protein